MKPTRIILPSLVAAAQMTVCPAPGADAAFYGIVKLQQFEQTSSGNPAPLATNGFSFQAFVVASSSYAVTNATVSFKPSAAVVTKRLILETNGAALRFEERFNSQSALNAAYPAGSGVSPVYYTNTMFTAHDGVRRANLAFWLLPPLLPISAPTTPAVANLAEAQNIDSTLDFPLRWNSLGGNLTIVQLLVLDATSNIVFATPTPFEPGALNGNSNSVTIPAGTLPTGVRLEAHLTAANPGLPNTNTYPGSLGVPALAKDLVFPMATRALTQPSLRVESASVTQFQLRLVGDSNRVYRIEATEDFLSWTNLLTTNSVSGNVLFTDPVPSSQSHRFYREAVGGP